ncbi:hypothetical protein QYE76_070240 [Lolium multiflorum]|uniref:DUF4218 domain-containing protein n=1 Tax=Lolium multiflorum TaxID=4521 RepID=A0AAD8SHM8_LOLMU|nr:hypothetical protein QYE76_070240 [Lolium multiflorum]
MIGGSIMENLYMLNLNMMNLNMVNLMHKHTMPMMMAIDFLENILQDNAGLEEEDGYEDDRIPDLLKDMYMSEDHVDGEKSVFADMIEEAKRAAVEGGKFSRFTFTVKLLHVKSFYRISNAAFNAILRILTLQFPNSSVLRSYDEALSIINKLGLGYISIHACPNNCVLFRKEYAKLDNCPICNASRWRDADGKKRIPDKVLRHFPLTKRLQRMFVSKKGSEEVQWHKVKRQPVDNELSHPADGDAWKDFDNKYPTFAADARNIRLGTATDGFNLFGMSRKYSMWPVFVVPYNLPPWACMDQSNFMMALLIPGPSSPGKDFDVFMEPLVEELLLLWAGVPTYDARKPTDKFDMCAAVIWCIHDYPALHTLSGRITVGYQASEFTKEELQQQLEKVKDVRSGKLQRKRKHEKGQCWSRRSCLWDRPYWADLKLRHNLDLMHIEKNICDNLFRTFLSIEGKTKDTLNSRLDLEDMDIRDDLHLRSVNGGESWEMPEAWYTMSKEEKLAFCEFIKAVRFPDGYASNLGKCVSGDGCKLQGLKTHDCHILLQRILPAGLRGIMHKDIYEAVAELGNFFRELCCKTLKRDVLDRLEAEIPVILCKLEKIFPPSFFDVMVHLAVHLPKEARLRGPVQYGWIFPVERRLLTCKRYVRNTAMPEGPIPEAYVVDECLTFCSRYFDDVETRFNRPCRNSERDDSHIGDVSVFKHGVNFIGGSEYLDAGVDYDKMIWTSKGQYIFFTRRIIIRVRDKVNNIVTSYIVVGNKINDDLLLVMGHDSYILGHLINCQKQVVSNSNIGQQKQHDMFVSFLTHKLMVGYLLKTFHKEECKVEALSAVEIFKATHDSKKVGFSADVQDAIAKIEEKLAAPVPDGEVPKSDVEIVSDVLTEKCPSSTFLKNVGLRSSSSSKSSKSNDAVTAHVHQLEEQLEMSQQQARAMHEEMATMKKKGSRRRSGTS